MTSSVFIVECECVWYGGHLYPKELAIIDVMNPLDLYHYILFPPSNSKWNDLSSDDQKRNEFLQSHHHRIPYEDGYNSLSEITFLFGSIIYTQGQEKQYMLAELFPDSHVKNIKAPSLIKIPHTRVHIQCPFDHCIQACATIKCYKLYDFYIRKKHLSI